MTIPVERYFLATTVLFVSLPCLLLPALASAENQEEELETIVVQARRVSDTSLSYQPPSEASVSKRDTPTLEIPQVVTTVTNRALTDRQPASLDEAVSTISGMTQANTLGGTQDAVIKRGFGGNRDGSSLRDGLRTIQPFNYTASVERIEVMKGPSSLLYGIIEPGGVINVISKRPELTQQARLSTRANFYGHGASGSGQQIDVTGPIGNDGLAYRFIADYDDSDYWRNFGTQSRTTIAPSLAWYGERTEIRLAYEYIDYHVPFDRGTLIDPSTNEPLKLSRRTRLDEPFNSTDGRSDLVTLHLGQALGDNWRLNVDYAYNRALYDDYQARVMSYDPSTGIVNRRLDGTRGARSSISFATFNLAGSVRWAGLRHDLLFGSDYELRKTFRSDMIRDRERRFLDAFDPEYGQTPLPSEVQSAESDQTDYLRSRSFFAQDSIHFNERWIGVVGARYQSYSQLAGRGRPFVTNTNSNRDAMVYNLGLIYRLTPSTSLYGSYTESFKPNSVLASEIGDTPPERGRSWELGAKYDATGGLTMSIAAFDIKKENVLVGEIINGEYRTTTAGGAISRGIEIDATGNLSQNLSLLASYAYDFTKVINDPDYEGNRLEQAPRHTAALYGVYSFGSALGARELRAGLGARYVGERAGNPANDFTLPSYTVSDGFISYDTAFGRHPVNLRLNVKNIADERYYSASASNRNAVSIGEPRQILLSVGLEL